MSQGHPKVSPGTFQDQPRDIYLCPRDISRLAQGHLKVSPGTFQDQPRDIYLCPWDISRLAQGHLKISPGTYIYIPGTDHSRLALGLICMLQIQTNTKWYLIATSFILDSGL
jgi:hypothetical protein